MKPEQTQKISVELSDRESEVLSLLMKCFSNQQIASELRISEKTVEKHLTNIYAKSGVSSRTEAVLWGMSQGRDIPT